MDVFESPTWREAGCDETWTREILEPGGLGGVCRGADQFEPVHDCRIPPAVGIGLG